jgi:hypothetical protein
MPANALYCPLSIGAPPGTRTPNPRIKRLRVRSSGAAQASAVDLGSRRVNPAAVGSREVVGQAPCGCGQRGGYWRPDGRPIRADRAGALGLPAGRTHQRSTPPKRRQTIRRDLRDWEEIEKWARAISAIAANHSASPA